MCVYEIRLFKGYLYMYLVVVRINVYIGKGF